MYGDWRRESGNAGRDWSRNIRFRPNEIVKPESIAELQAAVRGSGKIKAKGSRHSFNDIADSKDTWIDLSDLKPEIRIDRARGLAELPASMHTSFKGYEGYFAEIEKRLRAKFGARPHWGKRYSENPLSQYEHAPRFLAIRKQMDPQGKFLNAYLGRIFGES
jgi:FAD/FMN-containing dehydrogenase